MAAKKRAGFGFKISPEQKDEAMKVLTAYIAERVKALEQKDKMDLLTAVQMMDGFYSFKENLQSSIKSPVEKAYDILRFTIIPERMDEDDVRSVTFEGIGRVNAMDDIQVSVLDKAANQDWLKENDAEDLIQPTVNAQTLAAFLRKRLKDGKPMPPEEIVKVTPIVRAQITRSA